MNEPVCKYLRNFSYIPPEVVDKIKELGGKLKGVREYGLGYPTSYCILFKTEWEALLFDIWSSDNGWDWKDIR
jgi:hypothetical protein